MNATAIYSKSGKGVQEASGKTSQLSRPDRAVLSAIDGRATLADVAQKVGKTFDPTFQKLIETLDKGGFIREVSAGTAAPASKAGAAAKPAGGAPADLGEDLDFTAAMSAPSKKPVPPPQAGPKPAPPPPKINVPPPPPPPSAAEKKKAEDVAKQQQDAFAKAREDAERKAQADRDRVKAESEAKVRAETEAKLRAEAKEAADRKFAADLEAKTKADAEAKIKAARDAAAKVAAEAKAKAEAEAREARAEADRVRKEADERIRREQEEMKRKLEEERKAREEAERKAKEEARRLEEERRKLEEERKRREEERRKEEEERAARRKREEEEEAARRAERQKREEEEEARAEAERVARRKREEEEEARERAERKKREEEEEARQRAEKAMRDARQRAQERDEEKDEEEEEKPKARKKKEKEKEKEKEKAPEPEAAKPAGGGGFADTLLADLDSFSTREETEQKEREEAEQKRKEAEVRRRLEEEERKAKEEAERKEREEKERAKREAQEAKRREEEELKERQKAEEERLKDEEEKRKKEAEERERKAKQDERLEAKATGSRAGDAFAAEAELKKRRERQLGKVHRDPKLEQEKKGWGKPIALTLFLLVVIGVGVAHVMPVGVEDYERGATEALGQPVKINSANLSLYSGLQLKFSGVSIGELKIATVRAFPEIGSLTGSNKVLSRVEIEGLKLPQDQVGGGMFAKLKADGFKVERLVLTKLELPGPLVLPKGLEVDLLYDGEGMVRQATVRGPEALLVRALPKGNSAEFEMSSSSFTLPFASEISMSKIAAKGTLTPQGLSVSEWEGSILNGTVSGTANLRFGDVWVVNGVITARGINAAVFAPALLSDGRAEGSGKFAMRGNEAAKLASEGRLDASFTVSRGVLGSIDLSRAIQTGGKQATGRTQFNEMNGQATYDRGQIQLRNVQLSAGQLNAGASVDISPTGALSGRVVADVKVASQTLKANLNLGGTLKEPQVRN